MITSHPPLFCCTCEWETSNSYTNDGLVVYVVIYVDSISYVQVNAVRLIVAVMVCRCEHDKKRRDS